MSCSRKITAAALGFAVSIAAARTVYPDKTITLIVPYSAGGPTDKVARDLVQALAAPLHARLVVENVAGGGGIQGVTKVARAAPDGYTLLLHNIGMATAPYFYRNLPYRTLEDFEYLGLVAEVPMTVIGRPTLPARTLPELVRWLSEYRGPVYLADAGLGAASQLCGLLLQRALKKEMATVSYKGTAPAMNDLLSGQVDLMCDQTTNTSEQIEAGRVRAYAVTTAQRLPGPPALARLPTLDESGLKGVNVTNWLGLYAPRGTPQPVLDLLNAALRQVLQDAGFRRRQAQRGAALISDARASPAEHRKFVAAEIAKWARLVEKSD